MNKEYEKYLRSSDWKIKKARKLLRKRRCGICAEQIVDIHHLNYRNLFDVEMTDLRKMCRRCHFLAHDLHRQGKIRFTSDNHHSRWVLIKTAIKKHLGISNVNLFVDRVPD